jgi:gliding motility-associated-like protein
LRKIIFIISVSFCSFFWREKCIAQNYIPNGSFENTIRCPNYIANGISPGDTTGVYAVPWENGNDGTIDLYSSCDTLIPSWPGWTFPEYGIPRNVNGYQMPRTGNNYLAMCIYADQTATQHYPPSREYPQVKLTDSLKVNRKYCVSFYVSPADSTCYYSSSRIGCYISKGKIGNDTTHVINVIPQIQNPYHNFLNNYTGWAAIQGIYNAGGGENYITIGNFYTDANTDTLPIHLRPDAERIYYYLDDVSLVEYNEAYVGNDTTICTGIKLNLGNTTTTFGASYNWSVLTGDSSSLQLNDTLSYNIAQPQKTTTYVLQKQQCGINSYDTLTVHIPTSIKANAGRDTTICIGDSAAIGINNCSWCNYNWQNVNANTATIKVQPLASTTYTLNLKDSCTTTTSLVNVLVNYCLSPVVTIPNIFTPNGDDINEVWQPIIQNPLSVVNYQCTVYDRWGIKVYDTSASLSMTSAGWDGHSTSGMVATEGTYFYVITYTDAKTNENKILKGFLELIK